MKKVLYILFHRSVLVALSLLAQVVTLVVMLNIFSEYINNFYWCCIVLSVIAALLIGALCKSGAFQHLGRILEHDGAVTGEKAPGNLR